MSEYLASARSGCRLGKVVTGILSVTASVAFLSLLPATGSLLFDAVGLRIDTVQAGEADRRPPPATRQSETLSRRVYERIEEVMNMRDAEPPDYAGARRKLDEIREMYNRNQLNNREKYTMWLFYASLDQAQENYTEALASYREILKLENQPPEQIEQTWFYVGSLHYALEEFREAIAAFNTYNEIAAQPNEDVLLRIGTAYYQLEEYSNALQPVLQYMELMRAKDREIPQSTYGLLRALYLTLEDYENARQVLREMVVLFNDPPDWNLLASIEGQMENFDAQARLLYVADAAGYLTTQNQLIQLVSQLYNNDNPFGCGERFVKAFEAGVVDQDESNLSFAGTCYQVAREDNKAAPFFERAAEMSTDGDVYVRLGRIYQAMSEWEKSIDALRAGLAKGEVDRPDQVQLSLVRSFLELNRFDEGIEAARQAARDSRSSDTAQSWITVLNNEKQRYELSQRLRREIPQHFR